MLTLGQVLVPLLFTIISAITVKTLPADDIFPALVLQPAAFDRNFIPFSLPLPSTNESLKIGKMYSSQYPGSVVTFENVNLMSKYKSKPNIVKYLGEVGTKDLSYYNKYYQIAADFGYQSNNTFTSYFNGQSFHSGAISLGTMASALLKFFNGNDSSLIFINHPLPKSKSEKINDQTNGNVEALTLATMIVFGISFLAGSFTVPLIKERTTKANHLQYVSGVGSLGYWLSTYCWDIFIALIPCFLILALFNGMDIEGFSGGEHSASIFLLLLMYCLSILPQSYIMSFLFNIPSSGLVWVSLFNLLAGKFSF